MSFVYTPAKVLLATAQLDLSSVDIRALLVMSSSSAAAETNAPTIAFFSTLDEYDGASYARQMLTGIAVNEDDSNARAELMTNPITWPTLGAGTRQATAMILFRFVTDDSDSVPIAYVDDGGFPFDGDGLDTILTPDPLGLIQF